ncbi:MAG: hypothetical protein JSU65_10030 [Candidatus Zixiibacteriota bacterium]|nr:MAG: hypothetical protein JSU65_10030 [candidate division Zixibacteria bacterium]
MKHIVFRRAILNSENDTLVDPPIEIWMFGDYLHRIEYSEQLEDKPQDMIIADFFATYRINRADRAASKVVRIGARPLRPSAIYDKISGWGSPIAIGNEDEVLSLQIDKETVDETIDGVECELVQCRLKKKETGQVFGFWRGWFLTGPEGSKKIDLYLHRRKDNGNPFRIKAVVDDVASLTIFDVYETDLEYDSLLFRLPDSVQVLRAAASTPIEQGVRDSMVLNVPPIPVDWGMRLRQIRRIINREYKWSTDKLASREMDTVYTSLPYLSVPDQHKANIVRDDMIHGFDFDVLQFVFDQSGGLGSLRLVWRVENNAADIGMLKSWNFFARSKKTIIAALGDPASETSPGGGNVLRLDCGEDCIARWITDEGCAIDLIVARQHKPFADEKDGAYFVLMVFSEQGFGAAGS